MVDALRRAGMNPVSVKIDPDGSIVISDAIATPKDEFEQWQASRKR